MIVANELCRKAGLFWVDRLTAGTTGLQLGCIERKFEWFIGTLTSALFDGYWPDLSVLSQRLGGTLDVGWATGRFLCQPCFEPGWSKAVKRAL